ncbi:ATP-grasp fold amidoligase family protein [uncultured Traorella sp.]|uniref:ATP-grasp fold amidoligase family protein n=1 Tax=uncultured Traorella sp. TaxID=1929048 RepID=UPI0025E80610|nr:ATP-grasp fold amidoligase family protein [uncultured Traorella sp.]
MNTISKIKKIYRMAYDPDYRFEVLSDRGFYSNLSDEEFSKRKFKTIFKRDLDLKNPVTFNEKLQWLKLYNKNNYYTTLVDKFSVRAIIKKILGDKYLIPLLGVWENVNDIDFDKLPNQFVLKCTHNSGKGMYICKNKNNININKVKKNLQSGLKENYYLKSREWPYKNVKPRIIAEQYLEDSSGGLIDYKFFCFNGYVDNVMVCLDRHINETKFYFFNKNWELLRLNVRGKEAPDNFTIPKPDCIDEMFEIASKLSKNIPFVRIDLYECNGCIYFGEFTFYPQGGYDNNLLPETDLYFGNLIKLKNEEETL